MTEEEEKELIDQGRMGECLKCHTFFETTDYIKDNGIFCPVCRKRGLMLVGIVHRVERDLSEAVEVYAI